MISDFVILQTIQKYFVCLFKTIPVAAYNGENTAKTLVVVRENCTVEEAKAELDNQSEGVVESGLKRHLRFGW